METILFIIVTTITGAVIFYFICGEGENDEKSKTDKVGCYVSLLWGLFWAIIMIIIGALNKCS